MDIIEIIKDAFVFPSKDVKILLIYVILSILAAFFATMGSAVYVFGFLIPECFMWGGMAVVLAMLIGWVMSGYSISVVKSGIEQDDEVPAFNWWENFITGFYSFATTIVYYLIPAIIVAIVGLMTNIYGNIWAVIDEIVKQILSVASGYSSNFAYDLIAQALSQLIVSLAITMTVAIIVFIIFSFLETMAQARLANTGSLGEALNIYESAKDIIRIGIGKVIALILLVIIVVGVINIILSAIFSYVPILSILSVIITPYLVLFGQRAIGLLYSDIA